MAIYSPLILALGLSMAATFGIGLAAYAASIAAIVGGMVAIFGAVVDMMSQVNDLDIKENSKYKFEILQMLLGTVSTMVANLAVFMESIKTKSSTLTTESESVDLKGVTEVLKQLLGPEGITGIINLITQAVREINIEGIENKMSAFASIFQAVASILTAVTSGGPFDLIKDAMANFDKTAWFADSSDTVLAMMDKIKSLTDSFFPMITSMISGKDGILEKVKSLVTDSRLAAIEPEKIQGIAGVLGGVGSVLTALMSGISAFREKTKSSSKAFAIFGVASVETENLTEKIPSDIGATYGKFLASVTTAFEGIIKKIFETGLLDKLMVAASTLPKDKIDNLNSVVNFIKIMADIMSMLMPNPQILGMFNSVSKEYDENGKLVREFNFDPQGMQKYFEFLGGLSAQMQGVISTIFGSDGLDKLLKSVSGLSTKDTEKLKNLAPILSSVAEIFKVISEASKPTILTETLKGGAKNSDVGETHSESTIQKAVDNSQMIRNVTSAMKEIAPLIEDAVTKLLAIKLHIGSTEIQRIKNIAESITAVSQIISALATAFGLLARKDKQELPDDFKTRISTDIKKLASAIDYILSTDADSISAVLKKVGNKDFSWTDNKTIVTRLNNIASIADSVKKIINTLKEVNDALGLISKGGGLKEITAENRGKIETILLDFYSFVDTIYKVLTRDSDGNKKDFTQELTTRMGKLGSLQVIAENLAKYFSTKTVENFQTASMNIGTIKTYIDNLNQGLLNLSTSVTTLKSIFVKGGVFDGISSGFSILSETLGSNTFEAVRQNIITVNVGLDARMQTVAEVAEKMKSALNDTYERAKNLTNLTAEVAASTIAQSDITGVYKAEINSKGIQIKLNVKCTFQAGAVEDVILFREDSIIRNSLNTIYGNQVATDEDESFERELIPYSTSKTGDYKKVSEKAKSKIQEQVLTRRPPA
jgi:hypothetical protein